MSLIERLLHGRRGVVLDVAHDLAPPGVTRRYGCIEVEGSSGDPITMQLARRFDVVLLGGNLMNEVPMQHRRSLVHNAVQHLEPGGYVVAGFQLVSGHASLTLDEYDALCGDCELSLCGRHGTWTGEPFGGSGFVVSVSRRTDRFTVHDLVYEARCEFPRVTATELAVQLRDEHPPVVVDTRTQTDRARFGVIAGSIHVPRTVLEWHLDPANGYRHPAVTSLHQPMVLVCNRGYSSSLGAASLVRLGFTAVTDLIGGVHAWIEAGLPVEPADHDHLDL